ncbi:ABC transporter ATP-binding protein [Rhizobium cauense]|uniref:ABC transporter ATP-binding protein n=1 Tax=Rhizobium cauense TaxID=1166683 RepID=UPI001CB7A0F1|nr:phosphate ABC transporter ATP-binding protein [Rhizobium cauense]
MDLPGERTVPFRAATLADPNRQPGEVEARGVTRQIGDRKLVDHVNVSVGRGEILAVTGASGAGKSSFLRLVNRLDEPTSGTIFIRGRDYRQMETPVLRRRVGMVMQSANLFPGTVRGNVSFGPAQRGDTLGDEVIEQLLEKVGLAGYVARDVNTLSGGEAQRVSFARTLANKPGILLLDEPTSALDEEASRAIEDLILKLTEEDQIACLMVTHNAPQAMRLAKRTMYMTSGKVVALGPTKEVLDAHNVV